MNSLVPVTSTIVSDLDIRQPSQRLLVNFLLSGHLRRPLSRLRLGWSVWRSSLRGGLALACVLCLFNIVVRLVGYLS